MAGMLPGVECARRRRLYNKTLFTISHDDDNNSNNNSPSTRHAFSLYYPSNYESLIMSPPSLTQQQKMVLKHELYHHEGKSDLEGEAREAKQRLDDKLKLNLKAISKLGREGNNKKRKRPFSWLIAPVSHFFGTQ